MKESGLTVRAKLLLRRKGHPNRVRNVSWAVQVPVPLWRAFAHLITRKSKQRDILVSSDEEGDSPETFFKHHHKKLKSLLLKHLPRTTLSLSMNICAGFWTYQTQKFQDESPFIAIQGIQEITNLPLADHSWLHPSVRLKWARKPAQRYSTHFLETYFHNLHIMEKVIITASFAVLSSGGPRKTVSNILHTSLLK